MFIGSKLEVETIRNGWNFTQIQWGNFIKKEVHNLAFTSKNIKENKKLSIF